MTTTLSVTAATPTMCSTMTASPAAPTGKLPKTTTGARHDMTIRGKIHESTCESTRGSTRGSTQGRFRERS